MNIHTLSDLYQHMEWADAAVWASVLAFNNGQTDAKLRDYLYHLHVVQRAFLRAWRNEPGDSPYPTFNDAQSLMLWGRTYYGEALTYLETLSDEKMLEPMPLEWAARVERRLGKAPKATTIGDTVLQVALHSMYHRGQINVRLRGIGIEPPLVDYIAWIWLGRPAPDWTTIEP